MVRPIWRDVHDLLQPYPELPGEIDAGLNRENHSVLDRLDIEVSHARRFVNAEAESVADPVDEVLSLSRMF